MKAPVNLGVRLLFLLLLIPLFARGQTPSITECYVVWTNSATNLPYVNVSFSATLQGRPALDQVTIRASGTTLTPLQVTMDPFAGGVTIKLDPVTSPDTSATASISITAQFTGGTAPATLTGQCNVISPQQRLKTATDALQSAVKNKTPEEKNIFVGLNVAAPPDKSSQGDVELHLNGVLSQLSQNLLVSTNLRKATADKADSRQLDIGLTHSFNHNFLGSNINEIQAASSAFREKPSPNNQASLLTAIHKVQKRFWLAYAVDSAGRLEADPTNLKVTNAVLDLPLQFTSRTMNVFGSRDGWFYFRVIPVGFEGGRNLGSESAAQEKYTIARYKGGAAFGLFWEAADPETSFIKKIMFEAQGVDRYLFNKESAFDAASKKAIAITQHNKYYAEGDLKVYLATSAQGNYAFRVSFVRGGLPPVFADTKAFRYGFVFESADKK